MIFQDQLFPAQELTNYRKHLASFCLDFMHLSLPEICDIKIAISTRNWLGNLYLLVGKYKAIVIIQDWQELLPKEKYIEFWKTNPNVREGKRSKISPYAPIRLGKVDEALGVIMSKLVSTARWRRDIRRSSLLWKVYGV